MAQCSKKQERCLRPLAGCRGSCGIRDLAQDSRLSPAAFGGEHLEATAITDTTYEPNKSTLKPPTKRPYQTTGCPSRAKAVKHTCVWFVGSISCHQLAELGGSDRAGPFTAHGPKQTFVWQTEK